MNNDPNTLTIGQNVARLLRQRTGYIGYYTVITKTDDNGSYAVIRNSRHVRNNHLGRALRVLSGTFDIQTGLDADGRNYLKVR